MQLRMTKTINFILLISFVFNYSDVLLLWNRDRNNSYQTNILCICGLKVCCCMDKELTRVERVCRIKKSTPDSLEKKGATQYIYTILLINCNSTTNIPALPGYKYILPIIPLIKITYFPNEFELVLDIKPFHFIDYQLSVFHPPRS